MPAPTTRYLSPTQLLQHGGNGGTPNTVAIPAGDAAAQVSGYTGVWFGWNCVLQITITTRNGKVFGPFWHHEQRLIQEPVQLHSAKGTIHRGLQRQHCERAVGRRGKHERYRQPQRELCLINYQVSPPLSCRLVETVRSPVTDEPQGDAITFPPMQPCPNPLRGSPYLS